LPVTYPHDYQRSLWSLRHGAGADPLAFLDELASRREAVVVFSLAGQPAFLVTEPALAEVVLVSRHQPFVKASGLERTARLLGNGLLTAEGEQHRRQRGVVQPAFHRQQLDRSAGIMAAHARRFSEARRAGETVDILADASALTLAIVGEALFGADVAALSADIREALRTAGAAADPLISLLAPTRRVRPQRARLVAAIDSLIGARGTERFSLFDLLMDGQAEITDQVRDDALTILLAGHDTIATALVWTWLLLAQHPAAEARMHDEIDLVLGARSATAADLPALAFTRQILAESMRLYPPAWILARRPIEDLVLGGVPIAAGATVLISQYLMHRDARFFPRPLVFDPDRWLDGGRADRPKLAYFPFGAGPRACIGEGFAWTEGVMLLATIAQRWRLRLADPKAMVRPRPTITLRPPALRMTFEPRGPRR
jgi:cytochrome P450